MTGLRYCKKCILPSTRPNIHFDDQGNCNCATASEKNAINWQEREQQFLAVVNHAKSRSQGYDCVIPVSGGKDSTWQVVKCREYGLNPLAVTWKTPGRTEIGQRNLQNLIDIGVDHIDYQINPKVEKKFMYHALVNYGTTALPMHMALHSIPVTIATRFNIPLIVWGENSAFEYGGSEDARKGFALDTAWRKKYGVTHGTSAEDWVSAKLTRQELTPYFMPSDDELKAKGIRAIFLGYYFRWDPVTSLEVAKAHGFQASTTGPKTGLYDYADIDDDFISIHHFIKWYKFGFTRLFDNLSLEIRNGRMRREEAVEVVRKVGDQTPYADIRKLCNFLEISEAHFWQILETFRNKEIWYNDAGVWKLRDFILPDWDWSKGPPPPEVVLGNGH